MALHKNKDGTYGISSHEVWLPGCYEDSRTANYAFRFGEGILQRLQDDANARAGGKGGVITWGDLDRATPQKEGSR